jgi:hypothetical protein
VSLSGTGCRASLGLIPVRCNPSERRETFLRPCLLALLITCLHRNASVRARWVDSAGVVPSKELARFSTPRDNEAMPVLLQFRHEGFVGVVSCGAADVCGGKVLLTQNVQVVDFHDESSTASPAIVTLFLHGSSVSEQSPWFAIFVVCICFIKIPVVLRTLRAGSKEACLVLP